jgi:hypothetical protein
MKRVAAARTTGCYRNPYQAPLTASRWNRARYIRNEESTAAMVTKAT